MQNRLLGHETDAGKPASGSIGLRSRHIVAKDAASPVGPTATHRQGRKQLTDSIETKRSEPELCHVPSWYAKPRPFSSVARQNAFTHETAVRNVASSICWCGLHDVPSNVSTPWRLSTMAHHMVEAHEIPAPPPGATSRVSVQVAPSYCQTSPAVPTAIQNELETHETSF